MFYEIFMTVIAIAVVADIYDIKMTEKGIKKGVAVEGFDWLVGEKPSSKHLYMRDLGLIVVTACPALVIFLLGNVPVAFGCLLAPVAVAIRHIQGGLAWKKLLLK
jgi:hypothetical protein